MFIFAEFASAISIATAYSLTPPRNKNVAHMFYIFLRQHGYLFYIASLS